MRLTPEKWIELAKFGFSLIRGDAKVLYDKHCADEDPDELTTIVAIVNQAQAFLEHDESCPTV